MFKKFLAIVLSVAMIAAMWTIPVSAVSVYDKLVMDVDYSKQSREDQTGTYTFDDASYTNGDVFTWDADINRYVNYFDGFGNDIYHGGLQLCGYNLNEGLTVETYVKSASSNNEHNSVIFYEPGAACIFGMTQYIGADLGLEMRLWDGMTPRYGEFSDSGVSYNDDQWHHIVVTADATSEKLYIDGALKCDLTRASNIIGQVGLAYDASNMAFAGGDWEGSMAFFRMYKACAPASEVAAMYAVAQDPSIVTPKPVETPVPTAGPIVADNLTRVFNVDMRNGVSAANEEGMHALLDSKATVGVFKEYEGVYYAANSTLPSTNDYTYDGTYVSLDTEAGYTIEAYIYTDGSVQTSQIIHGFDDGYGWNTLQLVDGHIQWKNGTETITSTDALTAGLHHVVVANNADGVSLYIDGVLNKTKTVNIQNPGIWIIQVNNTVADTYGIALARFYQGKATDAQAAEMYTIVTGLTPEAPVTPAPDITPEPTPVPLEVTYTMPEGVANTTDKMPIGESFSYEWFGRVLCPVGEVSILNMCLWQMEVSPDSRIYTWEFNSPSVGSGAVINRDFAHVVLTIEGTTAKWYVDGNLITTETLTFQGNTPSNPSFAAGAGNFNFAHDVNAGLQIAKSCGTLNIYNRAATDEEVAALYAAAPRPEPVVTPAPIAAENLNLVFNVDARDGDVNNEPGLHAPLAKATGDLSVFEYIPYASYTTFNTASGNGYVFDGTYDALNGDEGYTIEAYVYFDASKNAVTFLQGFDDSNGWNTLSTTKKNYIKWADGAGNSIQSTAVKAGMTHVVITSNPTDGSVMYINGTPNKVGSHVTETGIWILNFCKTNYAGYGVALTRVYQGTATLEQAAEMYSIVTGAEAPSVTPADITITKPTKLVYNVGDTFDKTGLAVYAGEKKLGTTLYKVNAPALDEVGTKIVTIDTIYGISKAFSVKVVEEKITGLRVAAKPSKLAYLASETLDTTGLVVEAVIYNPATGEKTTRAVEDYTVSAINPEAPGIQLITVSYAGAEAQFSVRVDAVTVIGTQLLSKPTKLFYTVGESFDTTGMLVRVWYSDGSTVDIVDTLDVTCPGTAEAGLFQATISCGGVWQSTVSYRVR